MSEHDLEKLLGGFAANTLTPEERSRLYTAALQDQQLFNALADEQALKELLADPDVRRRLLRALQQSDASEADRARPWWAWFRKPAGLAFAGGLAAAVFAIAFGTRIYQESVDRATQSVVTEESKPAVPPVQSAQPSMQPSPPPAATELKPRHAPSRRRKRRGPRHWPSANGLHPSQLRTDQRTTLAENAMPRRERDEFLNGKRPWRQQNRQQSRRPHCLTGSSPHRLQLNCPRPAAAPGNCIGCGHARPEEQCPSSLLWPGPDTGRPA